MNKTIRLAVVAALSATLGACAAHRHGALGGTLRVPMRPSGAAANVLAGPDGDARLGNVVVPTAYALELTIDPRHAYITGEETITLRMAKPTTRIQLDAEGMKTLDATIDGPLGKQVATVKTGPHGGLALEVQRPIPVGAATLRLRFDRALGEIPSGLYRVEDGGRWYAFTQFEPLFARKAFPCFDQPGFKTPWSITLRVPKGDLALANTPETSRHDETRTGPDGKTATWTIFTFAQSRPLPSYLVAFVVGDFDVVKLPEADRLYAGGTLPPMRLITTHGNGKLGRWALHRAAAILRTLIAYVGRPYPFAKLDLVAVPNFAAGAMENAGLVTFRERLLLLDARRAPLSQRMWSELVIAHELSHMWFGDLVTIPWWNDLWLNEAFATWMETHVVSVIDPRVQAPLEAIRRMQGVMSLDADSHARAVRQPIANGGDVYNAFDGITYHKGAAVIRMLESWLGARTLRDGVRAYLNAHAYRSGSTTDFLAALDKVSGKPVGEVARSFLDQAGVPLVAMNLQCGGAGARARLTMSQRRYQPQGAAPLAPLAAGALWKIPVCVHYQMAGAQHATRQCVLLTVRHQAIRLAKPGCPEIFFPDAGEHGYYRWSLPPRMLTVLTGPRRRELDPAERIALPSTLTALLEAGRLAPVAYLDALARLGRDDEPLVLREVITALAIVYHASIDGRTPKIARRFAVFVQRALGRHLQAIGMTPRKAERPAIRLLRPALLRALAALGRDPRVLAAAARVAKRFVAQPSHVSPEAASWALPVAAWSGDAASWTKLVALVGGAADPETRATLIHALGSFSDPKLLTKSFGLLLSGRLRAQDIGTLLWQAARTRATLRVAWRWLTGHYDAVLKLEGREAALRVPNYASGFCSTTERKTVVAFFARPGKSPMGTSHNLALALEHVDRCVALNHVLAKPLAAFLNARVGEIRASR